MSEFPSCNHFFFNDYKERLRKRKDWNESPSPPKRPLIWNTILIEYRDTLLVSKDSTILTALGELGREVKWPELRRRPPSWSDTAQTSGWLFRAESEKDRAPKSLTTHDKSRRLGKALFDSGVLEQRKPTRTSTTVLTGEPFWKCSAIPSVQTRSQSQRRSAASGTDVQRQKKNNNNNNTHSVTIPRSEAFCIWSGCPLETALHGLSGQKVSYTCE